MPTKNTLRLRCKQFAAVASLLCSSFGAFAQTALPSNVICDNCAQEGTALNILKATNNVWSSIAGEGGLTDVAKVQLTTAQEHLDLAKIENKGWETVPGNTSDGGVEMSSALAALYSAYSTNQKIYHLTTDANQVFLRDNPQYGRELQKQLSAVTADGKVTDDEFFQNWAEGNSKALFEAVSDGLKNLKVVHTVEALQSEQNFITAVLQSSNNTDSQLAVAQFTNQLIGLLAVESQKTREVAMQSANSQAAWIQYTVAKDEMLRLKSKRDSTSSENALRAGHAKYHQDMFGISIAPELDDGME